MKIQKASPSQALLLIMACSYVVLTNAYIDVLDNDKTNSTAKSCTGWANEVILINLISYFILKTKRKKSID